MQNNTLPYYELQYLSKQWRDRCNREYRLQSRIEKLRTPAHVWFAGFGFGFGMCCLIAIHVAQLVG